MKNALKKITRNVEQIALRAAAIGLCVISVPIRVHLETIKAIEDAGKGIYEAITK